jgi:hypothetical protein
MNKNWEREQIDRLVALQQKKIDQLQTQVNNDNQQKSTFIMIIMIAAVAENNALKKTMICFGIYLMISKGSNHLPLDTTL